MTIKAIVVSRKGESWDGSIGEKYDIPEKLVWAGDLEHVPGVGEHISLDPAGLDYEVLKVAYLLGSERIVQLDIGPQEKLEDLR